MYDHQHGFRERISCETPFIMLTEDLASNASAGKQTDINLLDFSKIFDKVNLSKFRGHLLSWIQAFLGSRSQRVVIGWEESEFIPVTSGVSQGSVPGPILFLVYINDLSD